jgi:putative membrane protein
MHIAIIILAVLVALEFFYILFLETVATHSEATSRVFGMPVEVLKNKNISTLFKNQGVYNGLLGLLILVTAFTGDTLWLRLLLGYVVLVALYGALTSNPWILLKQGGLAILTLILSFILD